MSPPEGCVCEEADGFELVKCLAPPRGEYEVHVRVGSDTVGVVNEEGFFLRTVRAEETLPFLVTFERPVDPERVARAAGGLERLLCMTVKALREAASHGSMKARRKLEACRGLVEGLREKTGGEC